MKVQQIDYRKLELYRLSTVILSNKEPKALLLINGRLIAVAVARVVPAFIRL